MRLSPIRTIRIAVTSILIMLMASFSISNATSLSSGVATDGFQQLSVDCTSTMTHHGQHTSTDDMKRGIQLGNECPSDSHSEIECCGTSCIINIGADIHSLPNSFIQPSRRLNQVGEISFVLPFQADSLFRPPRV